MADIDDAAAHFSNGRIGKDIDPGLIFKIMGGEKIPVSFEKEKFDSLFG